MVRIFAREFEIDIALLVQPLMRTIAQGNRIKCETIPHDRSSRSHAAGPNVFACIGIETQGVINRNIVPHGFFGQLIAARWQASVTIVWLVRFLVNHSLHQRAGNVCEPVHREPSARAISQSPIAINPIVALQRGGTDPGLHYSRRPRLSDYDRRRKMAPRGGALQTPKNNDLGWLPSLNAPTEPQKLSCPLANEVVAGSCRSDGVTRLSVDPNAVAVIRQCRLPSARPRQSALDCEQRTFRLRLPLGRSLDAAMTKPWR
jgi:hypothetical protein